MLKLPGKPSSINAQLERPSLPADEASVQRPSQRPGFLLHARSDAP